VIVIVIVIVIDFARHLRDLFFVALAKKKVAGSMNYNNAWILRLRFATRRMTKKKQPGAGTGLRF
jgi:hypothetical protein